MNLRSSSPKDVGFLEEMLFEAFFWNNATERPAFEEFRKHEAFAKLLAGWGRPGDRAVVAEDQGTLIGAAWFRLWTPELHSYGFIDATTPELAIAMTATHRRLTIGRALLEELIATARADEFAALSLSVSPRNPARHFVRVLGFPEGPARPARHGRFGWRLVNLVESPCGPRSVRRRKHPKEELRQSRSEVFVTMPRLYITGTKLVERPSSQRTVFADGSADATLREGVDLELSHWRPNRTPARFKADTSTEICMKCVASNDVDFDLVVNNHADVDGILSVFTLLHRDAALAHRDVIVSAAEIGDFWGWGDASAQVLFQGLTREIDALTNTGTDPQTTYERALAFVDRLIERTFIDPAIEESLAPLRRSVDWVEREEIRRQEYHARFVHYAIPAHLSSNRLESALRIPSFNAAISDDCLLWPQARARWDRDKISLVSVETPGGWYYDVWYPSYSWADTPNSWRAPGLNFTGQSNGFSLSYPPLEVAAGELQHREPKDARWRVETDFSPFSSVPGRGYPVVLSVVSRKGATPSALDPGLVADGLARVFLT